MTTIPPWSYTAIDTFETCPKKYYHRYILKEKEAETEATRNGTAVHQAMEDRVKSGKPLPYPLANQEVFCKSIDVAREKGATVHTELEMALTREFKPTSFFGGDVWGRGKADVVIIGTNGAGWIGDWKTGKVREKDFQVKVFAGFIFSLFPEVHTLKANNIWLNAGKVGATYSFSKADHPLIWAEVLQKINRMELLASKDKFDPKPSGLCGWCDVKSCKFNTKGG